LTNRGLPSWRIGSERRDSRAMMRPPITGASIEAPVLVLDLGADDVVDHHAGEELVPHLPECARVVGVLVPAVGLLAE
jgi:hypothetical protein